MVSYIPYDTDMIFRIISQFSHPNDSDSDGSLVCFFSPTLRGFRFSWGSLWADDGFARQWRSRIDMSVTYQHIYTVFSYIYIFMHIIISIPTKYLVYIILAFCSLLTWLKVWSFFESADLASRWRWPFRFGSCSLSKVAPGKYVWMAWPKDPFWDP